MELEQKAKEILAKIVYVTIATVASDGQPWNSPVLAAYDEQFNFYWGSHKQSQHSINIANNNKIFLVIYDSTVSAGFGEGVYLKATAAPVTDSAKITQAHELLWTRHNYKYWPLAKLSANSPIQLYKATPEKIWINSEGRLDDTYIDTRTEVNLLH